MPFELGPTFNDPIPTSPSFDSFALAVALDGNRVLIGDRRHRTSVNEIGQAYLFDVTGGLVTTFDDPTPTGTAPFQGDNFGASVALDGGNVLIGAPNDRTGGLDRGQAHLFDAITGDLLGTFDDPTPTDRDTFGNSVALDGSQVLIGARLDDTGGANVGQAHLFVATTGDLLVTFDDPTPTDGDFFGQAVALDAGRVLIGASQDDTGGTDVGQAHLFDATTGALLATFDDPTPTGADHFGSSVALDGGFVLIGAPGDDTGGTDVGQAHLFDATTGALLGTFLDPTTTGFDLFGVSVALEGGRVLIGAPFEQDGGPNVGQAHLFDVTTSALLATFDDPTATSGDQFGLSVALDGSRVLIGAPHDDTNGVRDRAGAPLHRSRGEGARAVDARRAPRRSRRAQLSKAGATRTSPRTHASEPTGRAASSSDNQRNTEARLPMRRSPAERIAIFMIFQVDTAGRYSGIDGGSRSSSQSRSGAGCASIHSVSRCTCSASSSANSAAILRTSLFGDDSATRA